MPWSLRQLTYSLLADLAGVTGWLAAAEHRYDHCE
jgi:hypothetical protein